MSASQPANFNLQEFSDGGLLLVGGRLYTYAYGTTVQKTAYTDPAGAVPHTYTADGAGGQYIALNARGELPAPLYLAIGSYDIALKRADGSTVWTRRADPTVDGASTGASLVGANDGAGGTVFTTVAGFIAKVLSSAGASLMGFIQAGVGAVRRTVQDKLRDTVSPEDFGAVGDGTHDDTSAIQAAIDSFAPNKCCAVVFSPGKIYRITSTLTTNDRSVVLDGNNAIVAVDGNMTYGLRVMGLNCEVRNLQINKNSGTVAAAIFATGLQHVFRNITSRAQTWPLFLLAQDLKESHFTNLRVDNDVSGKSGIVCQFDYSVNNTITSSMLGFCAQAIFGSSTPHPTSGYHNEGLLISDVITVYAGKAVNFDNGTFIAISNCCFDFCELQGIFMSNGTDLNVTNTWIASDQTNGFIGIGTLAAVDGVSVQNCTFVRGAAAITGTAGVSLTGPNALVIGNRFKSGMNGGVVTQGTSQVIGNVVTGGGTGIVATNTQALIGGKLNVASDLAVGGNEGIFPEGLSGGASAGANGAPPAQVAGYATFTLGGTAYKLPYYNP